MSVLSKSVEVIPGMASERRSLLPLSCKKFWKAPSNADPEKPPETFTGVGLTVTGVGATFIGPDV